MAYWFNMDVDLMEGDTRSIAMTFATTAGVATDISAWTFYYKAEERNGTDTITVADGAMTKSDSGTGTVDTITIPLDNSITAVTPGRYDHEVAVKIAGEPSVISRGTLVIPERLTNVS